MNQPTFSRLVAKYVAAWNAHDVDGVASLFAEDGSYGEFGQGRVLLGQQEIRRYLTAMFGAVPDLVINPTSAPDWSQEHVFYRWFMTGTPQDEFGGVPPSGKRFEVRGGTALLTRGAAIVRAARFFDVRALAKQLWPGRQRRPDVDPASPDASPNNRIRREWLLADEDNIGYGE